MFIEFGGDLQVTDCISEIPLFFSLIKELTTYISLQSILSILKSLEIHSIKALLLKNMSMSFSMEFKYYSVIIFQGEIPPIMDGQKSGIFL